MASVMPTIVDGEEAIRLRAGDYAATFVPAVGMVGMSLRFRDLEFLALPADLDGYRRGAWTGLPILHPWANRLGARRFRVAARDVDLTDLDVATDPNGLPIHGTLNAATGWLVEEADENPGVEPARLRATFDHRTRPELLAAFPFRHVLELEVTLSGAGLTIQTALVPDEGEVVPASFGWHPYFRLPSGARSSWRLGLPDRDHVALDERGLPTGASASEAAELEPLGDRSFDDLYALGDDRRLSIESDRHRLEVAFDRTYPYAQVFAPPDRDFVCLEPMTAPTNALVDGTAPLVGPGQAFRASFTIRVVELGS
ncbi:MAG TPA: aldose 1-epimerase [Candidatus Limnocylindrales bacterium]|jgi:galactose mutarotase-like enzyme